MLSNQPGVDLILPGLDYLDDRLDDVVALVLTHGHEDHIGAVPYLLRRRQDIALFGSKLTLAFVDGKLREHRLRDTAMYHEVAEGDRIQLDEFGLEFFAVNHSIPDALAVAIKTAAGTVLHTGDFKMDQLPLDGRITDLPGLPPPPPPPPPGGPCEIFCSRPQVRVGRFCARQGRPPAPPLTLLTTDRGPA